MSGMFGTPSPPPTPAVQPPAPMPDANSPAALDAKRNAQLDIMNRAGRTSTILTAPGQRGSSNGSDYSSSRLGAAT